MSTKTSLKKASFTLDGVTVNVSTPFLPGPFNAAKPGDPSQVAVAATQDPKVHPFGAIYITAVPIGTKPRTEGVPLATSGGEQAYRNALHQYRANAGQHPQSGPTITIFGKRVQGEASLMLPVDPKASRATAVIEWTAESGQRIWIVRITQEQTLGVTTLVGAQPFLSSLSYLTLSSTTLAHHTTINTAKFAVTPNTISSNINNPPSWWNGSQCDDSFYYSQEGIHTYQLGSAHYYGLVACGPRPAYDFGSGYVDVTRNFGQGVSVYEWECVELSLRYLYIGYNQAPYGANGNQIVSNYPGTALVKINNGTVGKAPQPGDVLSYNTNFAAGHTSLVIGSNVDSNGNGTLTVLQQNSYGTTGTETLYDTNWNVTVHYWTATILNWLHDPGTSSGGSGGSPSNYSNKMTTTFVGQNQNGSMNVVARGQDGNIYFNEEFSNAGWNSWQPIQTGMSFLPFKSDPVIANNLAKQLEVFAIGNDGNMYHAWQSSPGSTTWSPWYLLNGGQGFQGTPAVSNSYTNSGGMVVVARGTDGNMWANTENTSANWSGWAPIQTGMSFLPFKGNATMALNLVHGLEAFAIGSDGKMYHAWQSSPGSATWSSWALLTGTSGQGSGLQGTPVAGDSANNGGIVVVARGTDGNMWSDAENASANWSGWAPIQTGMSFLPFKGDAAMVLNIVNTLEVFAVGNDGNVYHAWQTAPGSATWSSWYLLTGTNGKGSGFQGTPAVSYNLIGTLEVFALDANNHFQHNWQFSTTNTSWYGWATLDDFQGTVAVSQNQSVLNVLMTDGDGNAWVNSQVSATNMNWNGWNSLPGVQFQSDPVVTTNLNNGLEAFAIGDDGKMYHAWQTAPGSTSWTQWAVLTGGPGFQGTPAVGDSYNGAGMVIMARGSDGNMWVNTENTSANWSGWATIQTGGASLPFKGNPTMTLNLLHGMEAFVVGSDGSIYHSWQTSPGSTSWTQWNALVGGPGFLQGSPRVSNGQNGCMVVVARGSDGNMWADIEDTSANWSGWSPMQTGMSFLPFTSNATMVSNQNGTLGVFATGSDGNLYYSAQTAVNSSTWTNWQAVGSGYTFKGAPAVSLDASGTLEIFAAGNDGNLYQITQTAPNSTGWNNWAPLFSNNFQQ